MLTLVVSLAAGGGSVCRYLLDSWVKARSSSHMPWGTLLINVTGSLVLGLVTGLALHHGLAKQSTLIIGTGFAGGYTTWSTFMWETLSLGSLKQRSTAAAYLALSVVLGLAAAAAGFGLAQL